MHQILCVLVVFFSVPVQAMQEVKYTPLHEAGRKDFHQLTDPSHLRVTVDDSESDVSPSVCQNCEPRCECIHPCPAFEQRHRSCLPVSCGLLCAGFVVGITYLLFCVNRTCDFWGGCADPWGFPLNCTRQ